MSETIAAVERSAVGVGVVDATVGDGVGVAGDEGVAEIDGEAVSVAVDAGDGEVAGLGAATWHPRSVKAMSQQHARRA